MNSSVNNGASDVLTAKEIFDQIVKLQNELTSGAFNSMSLLTGAIGEIYNSETEDAEDAENARTKSVKMVCDAFACREETFGKMLRMYETMYNHINE